jgi:hypothetical protein
MNNDLLTLCEQVTEEIKKTDIYLTNNQLTQEIRLKYGDYIDRLDDLLHSKVKDYLEIRNLKSYLESKEEYVTYINHKREYYYYVRNILKSIMSSIDDEISIKG